MDRADGGDFGPLAEIIARSVTDNLHRFVVPAVAGPARLLPLASLAHETMSVVALRAAAERGRLRADKQSDGTWRSSKKWVDEYLASRHARGEAIGSPAAARSEFDVDGTLKATSAHSPVMFADACWRTAGTAHWRPTKPALEMNTQRGASLLELANRLRWQLGH